MTDVRTGFVIFILILIVAAMLVLIPPMVESAKALVPANKGMEIVATWDEEVNIMLQSVVIDPNYSHAMEPGKHADTAPIVHKCLSEKGQYAAFEVDKGKRYLRVCLIDEHTIGFQIVDIINKVAKEKTAYIREDCKCIQDVFDYIRRMHWTRFTKPF